MERIETNKGLVDKANLHEDVVAFVMTAKEEYKTARQSVEYTWLSSWAEYLNTPQARDFLKTSTVETVGNVNNAWRHKITTGKCFESIETIHSYFMSAVFPNANWFDIMPAEMGYDQDVRVVKNYMKQKFFQWNFRDEFSLFLKQLIIIGTSCLAMYWDDDEEMCYETVDMFNIYLDPNEDDVNEASFVRRIVKSRAEIVELMDEGVYSNLNLRDFETMQSDVGTEDKIDLVKQLEGVYRTRMNDEIEVWEFWGDINLRGETYVNVVATVIGNKLVRFESNDFPGGRPFVFGTYIPVMQQPYAMGAIQGVLSMLAQNNIMTNQRLDNVEILIDKMFTLKSDSYMKPEDVYSEPGRVLQVYEHGELAPLSTGDSNIQLSYEEVNLLEKNIDRVFGTGALISAGAYRTGDRVTAAEISAVSQAGGNRLSSIHKHIEHQSLSPCLVKTFKIIQKNVSAKEVMRVAGAGAGEYQYYEITPADLRKNYNIRPSGADFVVERQEYIRQRIEFLQVISKIPQADQIVDFSKILVDLVKHFGFDEPEAYLKSQQPAAVSPEVAAPPTGVPPAIQDKLQAMGGASLQNAVSANLAADGGQSLLGAMQ